MLINFFLQKCGAYLRAEFNTIVISLTTVFTRISAAALINFHPSPPPMRRLFEGGAYSSNYCNWQHESLLHLRQIVSTFRTLLHLGQNVVTFRTLLHLGPFITFRPSRVGCWSTVFCNCMTVVKLSTVRLYFYRYDKQNVSL